jgi:hypothetical protein
MGAEGQISAVIEPWLPVIGAVLGMAAVIIIQQVVQRQVRRFMQSREREAEIIKNHRYASLRSIARDIGATYEEMTLRGRILTHLELNLILQLYNEYKLLGGNGACDFYIEQIKAAHSYGTESWEQYRKLGRLLERGAGDGDHTEGDDLR